ncbi:Hpt domain-containing protein [Luteolibacter sp. SL250]|uniref:Hpt domain-containing protein n=1 Tax=Luteolibacter sp. SL250 TaxID=2995170 RepID=UPI00227018FF|nr:Hpt domain-containing protein [Luteolibacter sp. SL250]WAC21448.1 Hpt domain-containing protein [Luteolibacter sp. SL250]
MTQSFSADSNLVFNPTRFERMACGDLPGFFELAEEYFADVRVRLAGWPSLFSAGELPRLAEDFHRCKGGAAMFGLERMFSLLGMWEREPQIGQNPLDLERFVKELGAAEDAVAGFRANQPDA